jgi:hypothetical protein
MMIFFLSCQILIVRYLFIWLWPGVDLISGVSCDAPYEWSAKTDSGWEFKRDQYSTDAYHVGFPTF